MKKVGGGEKNPPGQKNISQLMNKPGNLGVTGM